METPGRMLSSITGSSDQHHPKLNGCVGLFFHLFTGKTLFSNKLLPSDRPKQTKKKKQEEERLPMAKLLLIADENRGGFPCKAVDCIGDDEEESVKMKKPCLVARLMGLESMPDSDASSHSLQNHGSEGDGYGRKNMQKQTHKVAMESEALPNMHNVALHSKALLNGYARKGLKAHIHEVAMDLEAFSKPFGSDTIRLLYKAAPLSSKKGLPPLPVLPPSKKTHHKLASKTTQKLIGAATKILEPGMKPSARRQLLTDKNMSKHSAPSRARRAQSLNTELCSQRNSLASQTQVKRRGQETPCATVSSMTSLHKCSHGKVKTESVKNGVKPNAAKQKSRSAMDFKPQSSANITTKSRQEKVIDNGKNIACKLDKNASQAFPRVSQSNAAPSSTSPSSSSSFFSSSSSLSCSMAGGQKRLEIISNRDKEGTQKDGKRSGNLTTVYIQELLQALQLSSEIANIGAEKNDDDDEDDEHHSPISIMEPPFYDESSTSSDTLDTLVGSKLDMDDEHDRPSPISIIEPPSIDEFTSCSGASDVIPRFKLDMADTTEGPALWMSIENRLAEQGWSFPDMESIQEDEKAGERVEWQNRKLIMDCVKEALSSKVGMMKREGPWFGEVPDMERVIWKRIEEWKAMAEERLMVEQVVEKEVMGGWRGVEDEEMQELVVEMERDLLEWVIEELVSLL